MYFQFELLLGNKTSMKSACDNKLLILKKLSDVWGGACNQGNIMISQLWGGMI
jgi:hypothetical protein